MTPLLPEPVPLDAPPGDPRVLDELAGRLHRAGGLLGELGEQLSADAAATPGWRGLDADAATGRVQRASDLTAAAAAALLRAGTRLAGHADLLEDARGRLARLRAAQEEDYGAAAARMGGVVDPVHAEAGAIEALASAEAARRVVAAAIRDGVEADAAATAAVLAECGTVASGGRPGDRAAVLRHLAAVLPGWHELQCAELGEEFAAAIRDGDAVEREAAARALLPWAHEGAVAAAVLTGLGAAGFRDVLRQLGDGSLSGESALARTMAAVLGARVPDTDAAAVARVREGRHVDPERHHDLDGDLVALGMGVVLAAARRDGRAGPPVATVREWGRQIIARERATGSERIVDRVRLGPAYALPGDPLQEVLTHLAGAADPSAAGDLLRGEPVWTLLLQRPWDDEGVALAAAVERVAAEPEGRGEVAVRAGLRALAVGLGPDGDPAGWTVDRATAAVVAPALAEAVAGRPEVVTEPLGRAAAGGGPADRLLLRGLGYLTGEPVAAATLDRGLGEALRRADVPGAVALAAGYAAVREYGQRLHHALLEFAAQEQAGRREVVGELLTAAAGGPVRPLAALAVVHWDLDGTWDAARDLGPRFPVGREDGPLAQAAYRHVAQVLGAPTAPVSPPTDLVGLLVDVFPGGGRLRDALERGGEAAAELLDDRREAGPAAPGHPND